MLTDQWHLYSDTSGQRANTLSWNTTWTPRAWTGWGWGGRGALWGYKGGWFDLTPLPTGLSSLPNPQCGVFVVDELRDKKKHLCEMYWDFLWFPWCWLLSPGQKICRRGTERPCYKVSYIHDSRRRLTFEDASRACRMEGGELLSIETESEQRLIERFIHQLQNADGDFWIGLRRSPERYPAGASPVCPSQYYWLDGSKAKYRFLSLIVRLFIHVTCLPVQIWALFFFNFSKELALGWAVMWRGNVCGSVLSAVGATWRRRTLPVPVEWQQLQLQEQLCLQIFRGWVRDFMRASWEGVSFGIPGFIWR